MFSFFKKNKPPFSAESIEAGHFLDRASERQLSFFFACWMKKKPRKVFVGSWFILYRDTEFIYWGWPKASKLFSEQHPIDEFYKINRKVLEEQFPNYKTTTGNDVRLKLHHSIQKELGSTIRLTLGMGFKAKLLDNMIEVEAKCTLQTHSDNNDSTNSEEATYFVILERDTLDLIKLHRIK